MSPDDSMKVRVSPMSSAAVLKIMARSSTFHFVFIPAPLLIARACATLLSSSE